MPFVGIDIHGMAGGVRMSKHWVAQVSFILRRVFGWLSIGTFLGAGVSAILLLLQATMLHVPPEAIVLVGLTVGMLAGAVIEALTFEPHNPGRSENGAEDIIAQLRQEGYLRSNGQLDDNAIERWLE